MSDQNPATMSDEEFENFKARIEENERLVTRLQELVGHQIVWNDATGGGQMTGTIELVQTNGSGKGDGVYIMFRLVNGNGIELKAPNGFVDVEDPCSEGKFAFRIDYVGNGMIDLELPTEEAK